MTPQQLALETFDSIFSFFNISIKDITTSDIYTHIPDIDRRARISLLTHRYSRSTTSTEKSLLPLVHIARTPFHFDPVSNRHPTAKRLLEALETINGQAGEEVLIGRSSEGGLFIVIYAPGQMRYASILTDTEVPDINLQCGSRCPFKDYEWQAGELLLLVFSHAGLQLVTNMLRCYFTGDCAEGTSIESLGWSPDADEALSEEPERTRNRGGPWKYNGGEVPGAFLAEAYLRKRRTVQPFNCKPGGDTCASALVWRTGQPADIPGVILLILGSIPRQPGTAGRTARKMQDQGLPAIKMFGKPASPCQQVNRPFSHCDITEDNHPVDDGSLSPENMMVYSGNPYWLIHPVYLMLLRQFLLWVPYGPRDMLSSGHRGLLSWLAYPVFRAWDAQSTASSLLLPGKPSGVIPVCQKPGQPGKLMLCRFQVCQALYWQCPLYAAAAVSLSVIPGFSASRGYQGR